MLIFFSVVHVLLCVFMVFVILLQPGKDAGMGSALGGGAVTFLGKVTAVCATAFFLTSLGLSMKDLRQSVTATARPPAKKVVDKPAETGTAPTGGAADPVAKTPPPPAGNDAVQTGSDKPGQDLPLDKDKPNGTEGVPAEKQQPAPKK